MPLQDFGHRTRLNFEGDRFEHWKYPDTVGNDAWQDDINFNSNQSSEYAKRRMNNISETTNEPYVFFEFMKIDEDLQKVRKRYVDSLQSGFETAKDKLKAVKATTAAASKRSFEENVVAGHHATQRVAGDIVSDLNSAKAGIGPWAKSLILEYTTPAARKYTGSIALYMPTAIAVSDQMLYNEDTRKFAAGLNELLTTGADAFQNKAVAGGKAVISAIAGGLGHVGGKGIMGMLAGYGAGDIIAAEVQRSKGSLLNPNEYIAYSSTQLRSFTFNWIFLPDSESESDQATGIIKFFRKSAHAKKNDQITITVPDHCVISFHGAKDMIQLPPCVVENVSVTYNPNVSSFFRHNNSPVEIGLAVTLKEMIPLYVDDVEAGY
jgi:hypothetical protein